MEKRCLALYGAGQRLTVLGDRLLQTPCQALAERQLNGPDKHLIATFQPEQHAHEIKLNIISAPVK